MSPLIWVALIGAFAAILSSAIGAFGVAMARRAATTAEKAASIAEQTHKSVNSRMDAIVELVKTSSRAEGREEGRKEESDRRDKLGK